ncbi:MAG: nucleotidyltransferase domain-containing protein [Bacteroidales bacterium]|nr:nucleotidyltransferase domain-containing protein [Bacteroidales bacterium]
MFCKVQSYLSTVPVTKAWVFGSFARGEETPESDLDLLVSYEDSSHLSLLKIIRYKLDIEDLIKRDVDLVEEGYLKSFAIESANNDKYLIYER